VLCAAPILGAYRCGLGENFAHTKKNELDKIFLLFRQLELKIAIGRFPEFLLDCIFLFPYC
jgi:hypothetical protein